MIYAKNYTVLPNQKWYYEYFFFKMRWCSEAKLIGIDHQSLPLRKRVAEVLGIAESSVEKVVSDWNKHGDDTFTPHRIFGRPKYKLDENVSEFLRTKILNANKMAEQIPTPIL
ncbi:1128_t:CDS:2 [Funneliformis geosporum]|nr:1128_t:CDS:2 [Funneliformis geosporum]